LGIGVKKCPPGSLSYVCLIYLILIVTTSNDGAPFEWKRPLGLEGLPISRDGKVMLTDH
jgi:hypothetical protein